MKFDISLKHKIILLIFISFSIFTNEYYTLQESIYLRFSDSIDYFKISNKLFEGVSNHHKLRSTLLIIFTDILNYNEYGFRFIAFTIITAIFLIQLLIFSTLQTNKNLSFVLLLVIICNPYIFRYYIAVPYYLVDLIFIFSTQIFVLYLIKKKFIYLFFTLLFGIAREQVILYFCAHNKFKFLSNTKFKIFIILLFVFFAINSVLYSYERKIIIIDFKYLIFICYPLLSYFPLFLLIFYTSYKLKLKIKMNSNLQSILIPLLIIFFIPYFIGYGLVGKNIVRLSNLSFLLLINFFLLLINQQKKLIKNNINLTFQNKYLNFLFFIIIIVQSNHPTLSKIKILDFLRIAL